MKFVSFIRLLCSFNGTAKPLLSTAKPLLVVTSIKPPSAFKTHFILSYACFYMSEPLLMHSLQVIDNMPV